MTTKEIHSHMMSLSNAEKAAILQRYFKTGPGQYGEGDIFLGINAPQLRELAYEYRDLPPSVTLQLIKSRFHEERLLALLLLVRAYSKGDARKKKSIYDLYLKNTEYINNWDLVDASAPHIVGDYLADKSKRPLYRLAKSKSLWERRISIISTLRFIKAGEVNESLKLARMLLSDKEDLIHKAVGWVLREVGKRDAGAEEEFLKEHYRQMPRTALRYAIERIPESRRQEYLKGLV